LEGKYTRHFIHPATLIAAIVFLLSQSSLVGARQGEQRQPSASGQPGVERDLLCVAVPGRSNDIQYGGVGLLVFDAEKNYRFVKRIATWDYAASQEPEDVKGIAASAGSGLPYVSTIKRLGPIDLKTDK
jgi:hypothetical protein